MSWCDGCGQKINFYGECTVDCPAGGQSRFLVKLPPKAEAGGELRLVVSVENGQNQDKPWGVFVSNEATWTRCVRFAARPNAAEIGGAVASFCEWLQDPSAVRP